MDTIMDVFFETQSGYTFSIKLGYTDTVLEIKEKIERYQRIPVSKQTLSFQGEVLLQDDLDVQQCKILQNSRLKIFVNPKGRSTNHSNGQVLQRERSQVPSNSVEEIINIQDSSVKVRSNNKVSKRTRLEQHPPLNSVKEIVNAQDSLWNPVEVRRIPMASRNNDQVLQAEKSPLSNSTEHIINGHQDSTVTVQTPQPEQFPPSNLTEDVTIQVPQPEQSPASNTDNKISNIQDSPVNVSRNKKVQTKKINVLVILSGTGAVKLPVNTTDHVKILRSEVVCCQKGDLLFALPQEGYIFMHKKKILNEDESFAWNSVGDNDIIMVQVPQTEQSPPSNSVKEITNNQDMLMKSWSNGKLLKQRIRVLVFPYSGESQAAMNIRLIVNTKDRVKILRNDLLQSLLLRGHLKSQDGHFFVHEERILIEDKSFEWNGVGPDDTVKIVPDPWIY